jgi:hypothetical protein
VARIAAVLCLLGAVALLPVMAYAAVVTTPNPTLPVTVANDKVVTLSATDSASPGTSTTTFFKIDSGAYSTYAAGNGTVPNVPIFATLGTHTLSYYSVDGNGTEVANTGNVIITDSLPPLTWAVSTGSWPTFDGSASFNLVSTDNFFDYTSGYGITSIGSGVASTFYSLDGGAWTSGTAISTSVVGTHTVLFYSKDVAGNQESNESATFYVKDNTPPVSSSDATTTYAGSATIHLSATGNTGGTIYYQVDGTAGDPWNVYSAPIVVTAAGTHVLTFYAVDVNGVNEAPHAATFTVTVPDTIAPVSTLSGVANGDSLAYGSTAHITVVGADAGSGMAALHVTVDGVARPNVTAGVRAATLFGAPNLGVPITHPGGNAASITSGNKSCLTCHPTLALPTAGTIDHTGITTGCVACHTVVDATPIVEPADHANHDPSWACNLCHGTSLVAAVMPADNGGNHFLGSEPDHDGVCADCHTFTISGSGSGGSTASTFTASFDVSGSGSHSIVYWSVDKAGNTETQHTVNFTIAQQTVNPGSITTNLTIGASPTSVSLPKPFVVSGLLDGAIDNNLRVQVMVQKPGRSYYSYSSLRGTYNASATGSSWWYRYTPTLRGVYHFKATFTPVFGSTYKNSASTVVAVTVH